MKIENTRVYNFSGAFHGMRNPKNSWNLSDSRFGIFNYSQEEYLFDLIAKYWANSKKYNINEIEAQEFLRKNSILEDNRSAQAEELALIGPNDMKLAQTLILSGNEHRKFLRQITVTVDLTAPLYVWKEFDTYKVGTTANSTSTMHKLTSKPIDLSCFETDDFDEDLKVYDKEPYQLDTYTEEMSEAIISYMEDLRQKYLATKDKKYWKELVRWLPESWLQTRTVTLNYEVLRNMYFQRRNHKLNEWHFICNWIESLPYAKQLICLE